VLIVEMLGIAGKLGGGRRKQISTFISGEIRLPDSKNKKGGL
jgi:hypothetical protein